MTTPLSDAIVQDWQAGLRSLIHEAQAMATELLTLRQERARVIALSRASDTEWTGGWAEPAWHCEHERIAAYQRGALLENAAALGDYEGRQSDAIESLKRDHQALAKQFVDMKSYADHVEIKRRALEDALTARRCHAPMLHQGHASYAHGPSAGHFTYTCPDCEPALVPPKETPA